MYQPIIFCDEWCLPLAEEEVGRTMVESLVAARLFLRGDFQLVAGVESHVYSLISFCGGETQPI